MYFSDAVSLETAITKGVKYIPLDSSDLNWAKAVLSFINYTRYDTRDEMKAAGYDIRIEAERIKNIYTHIVRECEDS